MVLAMDDLLTRRRRKQYHRLPLTPLGIMVLLPAVAFGSYWLGRMVYHLHLLFGGLW